ncbi:hypothetical protein LRS13_23020 [Svornostia abyssi]|uniref:Lipoprotein n=1 Tax=Svornostia abyssi TaxID=2898438 RepID=A0ABY5PG22_9ACTN|nr:hypothetical protein LRS13_23020 [Parviterribacteraceae bacterium J379]
MRKAGSMVGAVCAAAVLAGGCGDDPEQVTVTETVTRTDTRQDAPTPKATTPSESTARPEFYAPDSPWNTPIANEAALDPRSARYIDRLQRMVDIDGTTVAIETFSIPIYRVGPDQARVRVELDRRAPALQRAFDAVPVPDDAKAADGTDRALLIYQESTDTIWEFWRFRRENGGLRAGWGGRMADVSKNPGYYRMRTEPEIEKPFWGFNATNLGGATGVMTIDELRRGRIDHVLALAIPEARKDVCAAPANGTDGATEEPDAIPEGARFRLDPDLDVDALDVPEMTKIMARAAQRYGVVVTNRGGAVAFWAEDPSQYDGDPYEDLLDGSSPAEVAQAFPFDRLQTLKLQTRAC